MDTASTHPFRIGNDALRERIVRLLAGPDDPAKRFVISGTSYGALYDMAAYIIQRCDDGSPVCLCARDKAVVAAALLAAMAGGPTLVVPYAFDPPVLQELRRRTGFRSVVSDEDRVVPDGVRCWVPRADQATWSWSGTIGFRGLDTPWLHLFTGGSTGTPRMWTKSVRNMLAETLSIISRYGVIPEDRLVASVAAYHIYGLLYAVLTPLLAFAAVAPGEPSFPGEIEAMVRRLDATILISVPAHFRALNGHAFHAPSLRLAFSSAGMLAPEDAEAFSGQTGIPVVEVYGSTETGGIGERIRARGEMDFKPFAPVDVKVVNDRLLVRSDYLSSELELDPDGYFRTGDRARANPGNRFELLGRADGVVKVGGQRVDLEAVGRTLKEQPGVRDAVVISLNVGGSRENRIVAVIEADAASVDPDKIIPDTVAPYARPRSIKVVARLPLTAAGKIDRKLVERMFHS